MTQTNSPALRQHVPPTGPVLPELVRADPDWCFKHMLRLVSTDALVICIALALGIWGRFGELDAEIKGYRYVQIAAAMAVCWLVVLGFVGAYERRFFGAGPEEYKRVIAASVRTLFLVASALYVLKLDAARLFVATTFGAGLLLLLIERHLLRRWLVAQRIHGRMSHRVLAVGAPSSVDELVAELGSHPRAGFTVVGACTSGPRELETASGVPFVGSLDEVAAVATTMLVDVVMISSAAAISPRVIREIAWSVEGLGIDLIVAPSLSGVAGPRLTMRPLGGLALLHVDEPQFSGARRRVKGAIDLLGAGVGVVLLSPLLIAIGLAIRFTDKGPGLYRQTRIGLGGQDFRVFKFRTMYVDADQRLDELLHHNDGDGLFFKIRNDPRVTPIGKFLRKTSLDELPQLFNVLLGQMSLVGPRPLPVADSDFEGHVRRRLLVKPGMTGLWQVSGRSDVSWDEAVRLDLHYVENWSISLDLTILARTLVTVARRSGAY